MTTNINGHTHEVIPLDKQDDGLSKKCTWKLDDADYGVYATSCGEFFQLLADTPKENHFKFCCYCGGELVEPGDNND